MSTDDLFFAPQSRAEWTAEATRVLKGTSPDTLRWEVEPGIVLEPLYFPGEVAPVVLPQRPSEPATLVQYLPTWDAFDEASMESAEAFYVASGPSGPCDREIITPPRWGDLSTGLDGLTLREAGATRVETLAWLLAQRDEYNGATSTRVVVGVGPQWIPEIAFVRALRVLVADTPVEILAITLRYYQTAVAPHTNMLRTTLAASAALIGGADALSLCPHDAISGGSSAGLRWARQTHLLLRDESHLRSVADPAGAAFALDALTHQFVEAARARYAALRAEGSFSDLCHSDALYTSVAEQHEARQARVLRGADRIVGVTRSPHASDEVPELEMAEDVPLAPRRLAEPFEKLRAAAQQTPDRPDIYLYRLENGAMASARVSFVREFLAMAGLATVEADTPDAIPPGARAIVLCASDEAYAGMGAASLDMLASEYPGASLLVAGLPADADVLRQAGASFFIHARAPLYDHLRDTLSALNLSI